MTRIFLTIAISFLLTGTVTPQKKTDVEAEGLSGSVHTVTTESSESISIGALEESRPNRKLGSLTFNSKGQLVERVIYDDYGFLVGTERYFRDVADHLIMTELYDPKRRRQEKRVFIYRRNRLEETITHDGRGVAGLRQVNIYDQRGRVKEEIYYFKTQAIGKTSFDIDGNGNAVNATFFQSNGSGAVAPIGPCFKAHKVSYSYDSRGRVTEEIAYGLDGSVKRKSSYHYDDKGNLSEEMRVDSYSTLKFVHSYDCDAQDNWTKQTIQIHTSREPLFGDRPDESKRMVVKTRQITYY